VLFHGPRGAAPSADAHVQIDSGVR
jgi:hypothetical protein